MKKIIPKHLWLMCLTSFTSSSIQALDTDYWGCRLGILSANPMTIERCIHSEDIIKHLEVFSVIANDTDGNRATGTLGYQQSIDYVQEQLEMAGYQVKLEPFEFTQFESSEPSKLQIVDPPYEQSNKIEGQDFKLMTYSAKGRVAGPIKAIDLALGPDNQSTSGCEIEDFNQFTQGHIALIQRGGCTFQQKVEHAEASGAIGVIIFNQGDTEERKDLISATLTEAYSGSLPTLFTTYDLGTDLASDYKIRIYYEALGERVQRTSHNLIASSTWGDPNSVVMAGAHLDSVTAGAGINDNGSGSAALLQLALVLAKQPSFHRLTFAWWGAEELGLLGSTDYVEQLTPKARNAIKAYINLDMIGSPNGVNFIYDSDGSEFGLEGPKGSKSIEKLFKLYFLMKDQNTEPTPVNFRSDYAPFFEHDIAFGGLFTGSGELKTEREARIYGGEAGKAYDDCYHKACDTLDNIDPNRLELHADATAFVMSWLSYSISSIEKERQAANTNRLPLPTNAPLPKLSPTQRWGNTWLQ